MASCSLRVSNMKILNMDFGRVRTGIQLPQYHRSTLIGRRPLQHAGLVVISQRSEKAVFCGLSSETMLPAKSIVDVSEETKSPPPTSQLIPSSYEVESLLTAICDTTSVAEFELKLSGFRLYVTRDLTDKLIPLTPPSSAPVSVNTTAEAPELNGSVSAPSLSVIKSEPSSGGLQTFLDKSVDEGLVILRSPRVGFFRRSRTIKGKRAPPPCKEKQTVKEGQVLCYIQELGGELPVESDISGEVIKILRKDGEPVGYGDALIAILPSFPGI